VYHLELRQFPHNLCRFNLQEGELRELAALWVREPYVEIERQKWLPHQAKLVILEGPEIPVTQLSMGRGWPTALRQGTDVTDRVLAAAREGAAAPAPGAAAHGAAAHGAAPGHPPAAPQPAPPPAAAPPEATLLADSLGLELMGLLGASPAPLSAAWRLAARRHPERSPGQCLELAEAAVASLLRAPLIALVPSGPDAGGAGDGGGGRGKGLEPADADAALGAIDSWLEQGPAAVHMRRL